MKNPVKSSDQGKDSFDKSIDETIQLSATLSDVPGYQVQRELGRGAMAVVYEAEQVKLKRSVALKMSLLFLQPPFAGAAHCCQRSSQISGARFFDHLILELAFCNLAFSFPLNVTKG